jgi:hypothetical protein
VLLLLVDNEFLAAPDMLAYSAHMASPDLALDFPHYSQQPPMGVNSRVPGDLVPVVRAALTMAVAGPVTPVLELASDESCLLQAEQTLEAP